MRKFLVSAALAVGGLGFATAQAGAMEYMCDWDPPVVIVTPAGHLDVVYVSVWTRSLLNIGLPIEGYTTSRSYDDQGRPVTDVHMTVYVPRLLWGFSTMSQVSSGLLGGGDMLAARAGWAGTPVHLDFTLNEP